MKTEAAVIYCVLLLITCPLLLVEGMAHMPNKANINGGYKVIKGISSC